LDNPGESEPRAGSGRRGGPPQQGDKKMRVWKTVAAVVALLALSATGVLAQGKQWTKVKIATEGAYAPWNFTTPNGKLDGFEVDLANELCNRIKAQCEIIAQDWDGIIPALNAGKYDVIMAGMNITDKRLEAINFTRPYAGGPHGWAVLKSSPLAKLAGTGDRYNLGTQADAAKKVIDSWREALKGKTVGVQVATTNLAFLEKYFKDVITIREYKTTEQHDLDLIAGRVDAIFAAHSAFYATMENAQFKDMTIAGAGVGGDVLGRGVAVGVRKADPELQKLFDDAVKSALEDGTVKKLTIKWFKLDMTPAS
jgi:octopine/nopaline transport system substrate-binding protein